MSKAKLFFLLALLAVAILHICAHLAFAANGLPSIRGQHLGAAIQYAESGIDPGRPIIPGFNLNESATPQEFPFWQAAAALGLRAFDGWWGGAVLVSLAGFLSALVPLYLLGKRTGSDNPFIALTTILVFLTQPLSFMISGQAGADGWAMASAIWFYWAGWRLIERSSPQRLVIAVLLGTVSALLKAPFFFAAGIGLAVQLLVSENRRCLWRWLTLASVGVLACVVFFAWTSHCNRVLDEAILPQWHLKLDEGSPMWRWYFGDISYRLNPSNWIKGGWRVLNSCVANAAMIVPIGIGLVLEVRRRGPSVGLFAGCLLMTLVFVNLVLIHRHYYIIFCAPLALFAGSGIVYLFENLSNVLSGNNRERGARFAILAPFGGAAILLAGMVQGLLLSDFQLDLDPYPRRIAELVNKKVPESEKVIVYNGGWGDFLVWSGRKGYNLRDIGWLEDMEKVRLMAEHGFRWLVVLSESPLKTSVQMVNPGGASLRRETWREWWTSPPGWMQVYADEDILIARKEENN